MYYLSLSQENENNLIYYCRNCGNTDDSYSIENTCVSKTYINYSGKNYTNIINEYTKLDPTLPRINNIKCPNAQCKSNLDKENNPSEVIFIRYDDINMKYIYICAVCSTQWNTNKNN
tara:strand:- start:816 stop:1166 length:351 start_codon:yes stop_codon:yes gene_type:complete